MKVLVLPHMLIKYFSFHRLAFDSFPALFCAAFYYFNSIGDNFEDVTTFIKGEECWSETQNEYIP